MIKNLVATPTDCKMQTAWKHIRRTPYQALAAVSIMTITFFVATILVGLAYGLSSLLGYYETRPQVIAYLKNDATVDQVSLLQRKLESDSRVENVKYVSKEKALSIYKEATAGNPLLSAFVSPKVFPASLEFSLANLTFAQEVIEQIKKEAAVEEVAFTASLGGSKDLNQVVQRLNRISTYIRVGGGAMFLFLLVSSLLVLLVIISMRISARREEIEILQLLGATGAFIKIPFILEGMFYSIVGALAGWLLAFLLTLYLLPTFAAFFQNVPFLPTDVFALLGLFGAILAGQLSIAAILGASGSFVAIQRYLKI